MANLALPARRYRLVDAATKLLGVGLLAGAFDAGIASATGAALALAGLALGVSTVFVTEDTQ